MYQTIVLGLGFLLLFGSAYLIEHTDKQGILTSAGTVGISANNASSSTVTLPFLGTYLCDTDSGCKDPVTLIILQDGGISMQTSYADGAEVMRESGIWKKNEDGGLAMYITGNSSGIYSQPQAVFVKYATSGSLSGFSFDANLRQGWLRPVFRRQDTQNDATQGDAQPDTGAQ